MTTATPWPVVALGDVAETALGKMLDAGRPKGAIETPYLRNVNVQWGRIDTADLATVLLSDAERRRFSLHPGDLLVCEGGAIGRAAIWHGPEIAYQKALHRVRSRGDLDLRWLRYLLEHYDGTGVLAARATGSTIKHLPQVQLRQLPVPLPSLAEQRRIVDVLEDHLSRLDAATRSLDAAGRRAQTLSASAASSLMCLGAAGMRTQDVAFGAAVAAVPEHWRLSTLGAEAELVEYGSGAKTGAQLSPRDVPVLRMGNVKLGRIDSRDLKYLPLDHPDARKLTLRHGDLLFNRTNSAEHVGKSAVYAGDPARASFASYLIRVRCRNGVDPRWVALVINSPLGRSFVASVVSQQVGQANVNGTKLRAFPLPLPPLEEQQALVERHMNAVDAGTRLSSQLTSSRRRQEALRRSLLAAAFSGRL